MYPFFYNHRKTLHLEHKRSNKLFFLAFFTIFQPSYLILTYRCQVLAHRLGIQIHAILYLRKSPETHFSAQQPR